MLRRMSRQFEILQALAPQFEDEAIDESRSEVEVELGERKLVYEQFEATLRGKLEGVPTVVSFQRFYFYGLGQSMPAFTDVWEVFTTARKLPFEGTIRPANFFHTVRKWFGGGGAVKGSHVLYHQYVVMPTQGKFGVFPDVLCDAIFGLLQAHEAHDFQLQADTGFNAVYPAERVQDGAALERLVRQQLDVARMIG